MDFLELAAARYSVRKFEAKPVEQEKLDQILKAGQLAPTACNNQPQRVLVLNEADKLEALKGCTRFTFGAPLVLVVCYDKNTSWKRKADGQDMGTVDASIVATHMLLEIANLGLGTTWVGCFDPQKLIEIFKLPENLVPIAVLPVGYPDKAAEPNPNPLHSKRLGLDETTVYNEF